jgi:GNAT superfamily N-acetyltransferase
MHVRPMTPDDVEAAYAAASATVAGDPGGLESTRSRTPEEIARFKARYHHLLYTDPGGAWVAVDGERVVGSALALRRERIWGLSLLVVKANYQRKGVGKALFERTLNYAHSCKGGIFMSTTHPGAMRRYALAGFALHPTLEAAGTVRRAALPAKLMVRDGNEADLEFVAAVDRSVRGAAHAFSDIQDLLRLGGRLLVAEAEAGQGYAVAEEGSPGLLAATTSEAATDLLWACLAELSAVDAKVRWLTASQQWAMPVVLAAGLVLAPAGPVCVQGEVGPLTPYLPNNLYL